MELGEKLRKIRLEAGLSQRQLCDGIITRNMLSQIENGSARPSMQTLSLLSQRLGKSIGFFLEDTAIVSPNTTIMETARQRFDAGDFSAAARILESYQSPDPVYDREMVLLQSLTLLSLAEAALEQGKHILAKTMLEKMPSTTAYCHASLTRQQLLLLGRIPGERVSARLPGLDEELLLRARENMDDGNFEKAAHLLEAAEDHSLPQWKLLRGKTYSASGNHLLAIACLKAAEGTFPEDTAPLLEICYRELGNYQQAYYYACRQKK